MYEALKTPNKRSAALASAASTVSPTRHARMLLGG
jgi:hypothetical protein